MNRLQRAALLCLAAATAVPAQPAIADAPAKSVPEQIVDQASAIFGPQRDGNRALHAKGIVAEGTFVPTPAAAKLSKAAHFSKGSVPVVVRFSDSTGLPQIADTDSNARPNGLSIRFQLADDEFTDIVAHSYNGFPAATPEDFLKFLQAVGASRADAPHPTPIEQFLGTHPAAATFVKSPKPLPASFTTQAYFGVNAFNFTNAAGKMQPGRYRILPEAGTRYIADEQLAKLAPNILSDELRRRLAKGPARMKLLLQLPEAGDSTTDATAVWPDTRKTVLLGTITLKRVLPDSDAQQRVLAFSPLNLVDGIQPSADPLIVARAAAYGVSFGRRQASLTTTTDGAR